MSLTKARKFKTRDIAGSERFRYVCINMLRHDWGIVVTIWQRMKPANRDGEKRRNVIEPPVKAILWTALMRHACEDDAIAMAALRVGGGGPRYLETACLAGSYKPVAYIVSSLKAQKSVT